MIKGDVKENFTDLWRLLVKIEEDHANRFFEFSTPANILNLPLFDLNNLNADSVLETSKYALLNRNVSDLSYFRNLIRSLKLRIQNYLNWIQMAIITNINLASKIKSVYRFK